LWLCGSLPYRLLGLSQQEKEKFMKLNKYFFKRHWHTLWKRFFNALQRLKRATFEFLGRLPRTEDMRVRFRMNTFLKDGRYFLQAQYARLVIRSEYTKRDLAVLFVVAFFVGYGLKTAAAQVITIGFDDYTLPPKEMLFDLNAVQKKMIENGSVLRESDAMLGGACSE